jgi:pyruvate dehydrogenase E2 component (dihydrolipoamide acetyltransferase)
MFLSSFFPELDNGCLLRCLLPNPVLQGTKVSVNDFVMRAAALALRDTPEANAFWDKASETAVQQPSVDVCVAVATDGGLITPIVKAADTKSLMQVSRRWVEQGRTAAGKDRRKLKLHAKNHC